MKILSFLFITLLFTGNIYAQPADSIASAIYCTQHELRVNSVDISPNGEYAASGAGQMLVDEAGEIKLWKTETGRLHPTRYNGLELPVQVVRFTHDNQLLLSGGGNRTIGELKLWDIFSGKMIRQFSGAQACIVSAEFSNNGKWLVTLESADTLLQAAETLRIWDVETGRLLETHESRTEAFLTATFGTNDNQIIVSTIAGEINFFDREIWVIDHTITPLGNPLVTATALSPDGQYLVTASSKNRVEVWDLEKDILHGTYCNHCENVSTTGFRPGAATIFAAGGNARKQQIMFWDFATEQTVLDFSGNGKKVNAADISDDGKTLVFASGNTVTIVPLNPTE